MSNENNLRFCGQCYGGGYLVPAIGLVPYFAPSLTGSGERGLDWSVTCAGGWPEVTGDCDSIWLDADVNDSCKFIGCEQVDANGNHNGHHPNRFCPSQGIEYSNKADMYIVLENPLDPWIWIQDTTDDEFCTAPIFCELGPIQSTKDCEVSIITNNPNGTVSGGVGECKDPGLINMAGVCRACNVRTELPRPLQLIIASQSTGRIIYDVTDECDQIGGGL